MIVALIASAAYFAFVCLYLSAHRMMWADELTHGTYWPTLPGDMLSQA